MLADGKYRARAVSWGLGAASTGKEQVAVEFQIENEEARDQTIVWYGYFTEKTLETTVKALRACGWQGDDLSELKGLGDNEVSLVVEQETGEDGKTYARVRWVNRPGGLALKTPLQADAAKVFAARMKGEIVKLGKGEAKPRPKAQPRAEEAGEADGDIPF